MKKEVSISIYNIPIIDIYRYLENSGIPLPFNDEEAYELAEELIESGVIETMPFTVANWYIAKNLPNNNLGTYNLTDIIRADNNELIDLADQLDLDVVEKDRIIDILSYSGKLNDDLLMFDYLPKEILIVVLENLDYNDLMLMSDLHPLSKEIIESNYFANILNQKYQKYLLTPDGRLSISNIVGTNSNNQFRIVDRNKSKYSSSQSRGLACGGTIGKTIPKAYLIDVMWRTGVIAPVDINLNNVTDENRDIIIDQLLAGTGHKLLKDGNNQRITDRAILESWSNDKLDHYYKLIYSNLTTQDMCDLIYNRLDDTGRIQ